MRGGLFHLSSRSSNLLYLNFLDTVAVKCESASELRVSF
jgi:hypothetical protein